MNNTVSENCRLYAFLQIWGVAIGGAILQNGLLTKLPASFLSLLPRGAEVAYATIPQIPNLEPTLRATVQEAFASSLRTIWLVMLGASGLGLLASLFMSHHELTRKLDEKWTRETPATVEPEHATSSQGTDREKELGILPALSNTQIEL